MQPIVIILLASAVCSTPASADDASPSRLRYRTGVNSVANNTSVDAYALMANNDAVMTPARTEIKQSDDDAAGVSSIWLILALVLIAVQQYC